MPKIHIERKPTDFITTRLSLGGDPKIGYYCVYRGTIEDARKVLEVISAHIETMEELEVTDN